MMKDDEGMIDFKLFWKYALVEIYASSKNSDEIDLY